MQNNVRNIFVASIVVIEWFEFSFYLYLGFIFSEFFFPKGDKHGVLIVYFIFFISYLSRPLGALIFGALSDFVGRKKPLILSAFLVGLSTMLIGFIPSFAQIGWYAPLLLLVFRTIQALSVSGEFNNSALYLIESSQINKKIVGGSITGFGSSLGMFLGGVTALLIMAYDSNHQAWRMVYVVLGFIGVLTCYLRGKLSESSEYQNFSLHKDHMHTLTETLKSQYKNILSIIVIAGFMAMYIYTLNIFFANYLVEKRWYSQYFSLLMIIIAQGATTLLIPVYARLINVINYKKYMFLAISGIGITSILFFSYANHLPVLIIGVSLYALANGYLSTVVFYYMYSLLRVEYRCSITSLSWAIPATIIGGASLPVAQILASYGLETIIVAVVIIFSLICMATIKMTQKLNFKTSNKCS